MLGSLFVDRYRRERSRRAAAPSGLDVPMDRGLVSVVVRFGVGDKEPPTWEGSYRLTDGRIVATDGWRFAGDDYATVSKFKLDVRRFYPRFWNRRGNADARSSRPSRTASCSRLPTPARRPCSK